MNKKLSVVTPCYNEEGNIEKVYQAVKQIRLEHPEYDWEHLFIDNASTDKTIEELRALAQEDKDVKVILNVKNFGHIKSHVHGYVSATGDAVMVMFADLQDPPELLHTFIEKWEAGHKVVVGQKETSEENPVMFFLRKAFYVTIEKISDTEQIKNFTGFGLYDQSFLKIVRQFNDPYPYFRGIVSEYGENIARVPYKQRLREVGVSKNNFYTLYDSAMLGFVSYSRIPLRLASFIGMGAACLCLGVSFFYFLYKLFYWDTFQLGVAPMVIGISFTAAIQLFFIGVIGEYVGTILTQVKGRPLVIEKERINFEEPQD